MGLQPFRTDAQDTQGIEHETLDITTIVLPNVSYT